jgi:hypothetical protein
MEIIKEKINQVESKNSFPVLISLKGVHNDLSINVSLHTYIIISWLVETLTSFVLFNEL